MQKQACVRQEEMRGIYLACFVEGMTGNNVAKEPHCQKMWDDRQGLC